MFFFRLVGFNSLIFLVYISHVWDIFFIHSVKALKLAHKHVPVHMDGWSNAIKESMAEEKNN